MIELTKSPLFGMGLSILSFYAGVWLNKKLKTPLVNPLLVAMIIIMTTLTLFRIPVENYNIGGDLILAFLVPATASLALSIYRQFELLKQNWLPVLVGTAVGSAAAIGCVMLLCHWMLPDPQIVTSLLPKSVTTPIAVELCRLRGGIAAITVAAVVITGVFGAVASPLLLQMFRITNPVAAGVAIGTSTHAAGTSKAVELGEIQGAMSGISIGVAGLFTVVYLLFI